MYGAVIVGQAQVQRRKGDTDSFVERFSEKVTFIWSIAELLRGDFKAFEYGKVILPFVVLRRLDCVLEPTKDKVLAEASRLKVKNPELILQKVAGQPFYNTSKLDFRRLLADPDRIARNMQAYIRAFSASAQDILENFDFDEQIERLDRAGLLYKVVGAFAELDLHPSVVSNLEMGYIFEELIRRFSEQSNETAGEHFTPREVIGLMVNLLFAADREFLEQPGAVRTLYDPAAGTGGMLSVAGEHLHAINPKARLVVFGQELNPESYAICKSDMMLKGQDPTHIHRGNSFTEDGEPDGKFDYMLSNPPFGVDWKKIQEFIEREHEEKGFDGRFGAGLPRINDGSLLFLQHMVAKMKPTKDGGSRIAIVFNASPLFNGGAASGESEIRRWIIEHDWLEAIVAMPDEIFYNTGISTYVWVLTNRKPPKRRDKVQLVDGREFFRKMPKSLGNKRNELGPGDIETITRLYLAFTENEKSKILPNRAFGYRRVTIERPLHLRYAVTAEAIAALRAKLGPPPTVATAPNRGRGGKGAKANDGAFSLVEALEHLIGTTTTDRAGFEALLDLKVFGRDGKIPARVRRLVFDAVSVTDAAAPIVTDAKGRPQADPDLRTYEAVPLGEDVEAYFAREVRPHEPDAWLGADEPKVGYEVPFTRVFYRYEPQRSVGEINADVRSLEERILLLLGGTVRG